MSAFHHVDAEVYESRCSDLMLKTLLFHHHMSSRSPTKRELIGRLVSVCLCVCAWCLYFTSNLDYYSDGRLDIIELCLISAPSLILPTSCLRPT